MDAIFVPAKAILIILLLTGWGLTARADWYPHSIRIISLSPHLTELLYSAGAEREIVAVSDFSDYPPDAQKLPTVGGAWNINLERIADLHPDLVLLWGRSPLDRERLQRLGVKVYQSTVRRLDDIPRELRALGSLAATSETANKAADEFQQNLAQLQARYSKRRAVRVFYESWNQPLLTVINGFWIDQIISSCGGRSIIYGTAGVSFESVLEANPEVIIVSNSEWLPKWRRWSKLVAVTKKNLFYIPADLLQRPTVRVLEGARQLCVDLELARQSLSN